MAPLRHVVSTLALALLAWSVSAQNPPQPALETADQFQGADAERFLTRARPTPVQTRPVQAVPIRSTRYTFPPSSPHAAVGSDGWSARQVRPLPVMRVASSRPSRALQTRSAPS